VQELASRPCQKAASLCICVRICTRKMLQPKLNAAEISKVEYGALLCYVNLASALQCAANVMSSSQKCSMKVLNDHKRAFFMNMTS